MAGKAALLKQILILSPDPHLALRLQDTIASLDPVAYPYLLTTARTGQEATRQADLAEPDLLVAQLATLQSADALLTTFLLESLGKHIPLLLVHHVFAKRTPSAPRSQGKETRAPAALSPQTLLPPPLQHLLRSPGVLLLPDPVSVTRLLQTLATLLPPDGMTAAAPAASPTILLCEDDPDLGRLLSKQLKRLAFRVELASSGAEALRLARRTPPALLLTDLDMPSMSGLELMQALRQELPELPVILLTGRGSEEAAATALKLGANRYLTKPYKMTDLENAIRTLLAQRTQQRLQVAASERLRQLSRELLQSSAELQQSLTTLELLAELSQQIRTNLAGGEVLDVVTRALVSSFEATFAGIWLKAESADLPSAYATPIEVPLEPQLILRSWAGAVQKREDLATIVLQDPLPIAGIARTSAAARFTRNTGEKQNTPGLSAVSEAEQWLEEIGEESFCGFPLLQGTECSGVIAVFSPAERLPVFVRVLTNVSHLVSVALQDTQLFQQLEQERTKLLEVNQKLLEVNQKKSDFVTTVSHDLRSPLTGVTGFTELLLAEKAGPLTARQRNFLERIQSSSQSMLAIIVDLLDLARIESGLDEAVETVTLAPVLAEALAIAQPQAEFKGIELRVLPGASLEQVWLRANPARLQQALLNVISNAVKYTPEGGRIEIEVKVEQERRGERVQVWVSDSGMGIPAADLPFIFDKFYRVTSGPTSTIGGTGLGLALVKSIIEQLNGSIRVMSEPGKGTTFTITLPCLVHPS